MARMWARSSSCEVSQRSGSVSGGGWAGSGCPAPPRRRLVGWPIGEGRGWTLPNCWRRSRTRRRSPQPTSSASASRTLGASEVSFLVADFSGRALVRLGHAGSDDGRADQGRETARARAVDGQPAWRALRQPDVEVEADADGTRLFAPVTNRGEAIGVLELTPSRGARRADAGGRRARGARARVRHHRQPPVHRPLRVGPTLGPAVARGRDPASPAPGLVHVRGRAVHARGLAGAFRATSPATRSTSRSERDTLHLSITDAMGHAVNAAVLATRARRRAAQRPPSRRRARRAGAARQRRPRRPRRMGTVRDRACRAHRPARGSRDHRQRRSSAAAATARRATSSRSSWRPTRRSARCPTTGTGCSRCRFGQVTA